MKPEPEELLDQCIEYSHAGGDLADILRQRPESAEEVRHLLALSTELEDLPDPPPSLPGLMRTLTRAALQTREADVRGSRSKFRLFPRRVLTRVAAIFLCVCLVGWGTVAASSDALPGDPLYMVKLLTERARFFLTVNEEARAELRIVFSSQRLTEAIRRYQAGDGIDEQVLRAMLDEAQLAIDAGPALPEAQRGLFLSRVAYMSDFQKSTLEQLEGRVGPEEQRALAPFIEACGRRCEQMCQMMGCGGNEKTSEWQWTCSCPKCP